MSYSSFLFTFFFFKKGRESGFYLFILCKHMTCAWEDDTWGTRFFKHTVELLGESAIQMFYPWQEYNFPFSGKEVWNFVCKGRKVHNKIKKSLFGCQKAHKEKTFKWVRHLNQKNAKYFQLLRNFKKQHPHFPGNPFILLKGQILELAISLGIGESMSYTG